MLYIYSFKTERDEDGDGFPAGGCPSLSVYAAFRHLSPTIVNQFSPSSLYLISLIILLRHRESNSGGALSTVSNDVPIMSTSTSTLTPTFHPFPRLPLKLQRQIFLDAFTFPDSIIVAAAHVDASCCFIDDENHTQPSSPHSTTCLNKPTTQLSPSLFPPSPSH
jgi:hypothetical protein